MQTHTRARTGTHSFRRECRVSWFTVTRGENISAGLALIHSVTVEMFSGQEAELLLTQRSPLGIWESAIWCCGSDVRGPSNPVVSVVWTWHRNLASPACHFICFGQNTQNLRVKERGDMAPCHITCRLTSTLSLQPSSAALNYISLTKNLLAKTPIITMQEFTEELQRTSLWRLLGMSLNMWVFKLLHKISS